MALNDTSDLRVLIEKLTRICGLSDEDRTALELLPLQKAVVAKGSTIVWAGSRADRCTIVLEGTAFAYRMTGESLRQIMGLYLVGDLPDLQSLHFGMTDISVATLSPCRVGFISHDALHELCSRHPHLLTAFWRVSMLQAAIVREWLLNVGRRDALARLAHLMCEMVVRHRTAGLTTDYSCSFPFTQIALADALGLSIVHVNRVVQRLRYDNLIEWDGRRLTVLDWNRIKTLGDFDPTYLRLSDRPKLHTLR